MTTITWSSGGVLTREGAGVRRDHGAATRRAADGEDHHRHVVLCGAPHRLPQPGWLNLREVLERVRSLIQAEFPQDVVIDRDYDVSLPPIKGDKEQLIQAVLNVVRNAAQAIMGSGGKGTIQLRTRVVRPSPVGIMTPTRPSRMKCMESAMSPTFTMISVANNLAV